MLAKDKFPLILERVRTCEYCGRRLAGDEPSSCVHCLNAFLTAKPNEQLHTKRVHGHYRAITRSRKLS
jgi:hypothetical protein